jgi:spore coat protein U-like protein
MKQNKKFITAQTTTALTSLIALLIVSNNASAATTSSTFTAQTVAENACTLAATTMTFGSAYNLTQLTQSSDIVVNCTANATFSIYFTDAADGVGSGQYKLIRTTTDGTASANFLNIAFNNGTNTMTLNGATITGTGTGSSATAGTITGIIAAGQASRTAGTFTKTMTLNVAY